MLDLVLKNKEGLVGNVKLDCSDHEWVDFKILGAGRRVHRKFTTLHFGRKTLTSSAIQLAGPWDKSLEGRGAQEKYFIFKDLLQAQEWCIPTKHFGGEMSSRWTLKGLKGGPMQTSESSAKPSAKCCIWIGLIQRRLD